MASTKFKTPVEIQSDISLTPQTANRVLATDASKKVVATAVTDTELSYLTGVTSSIQDQLDAKIDESREAQPNGIATLDGAGKIPVAQLPSAVMTYEGNWNASTNSPTLADGTGDAGMVYRVNVAGTQNLGSGAQVFSVGDWVVYNGTIWQQSDNADAVMSVNGFTGVVVLDTDDIAEGANLYFTDERAQDAVGTILVDTASVDLAYNDGTPSITATVLPAGVDHDQLLNFVANEHVDHSTVSIATAAATSGLTGGGNITATRNLSVDINGTTLETTADNADKVLIWDNSASALKSMSRANFLGGAIPQDTDDLPEGATNLYFTDERAQDAVGTILVDSASIDFTYNDGTPSITAAVLPAGVDHNALLNFVANKHIDHSTVNIATAAATSGLSGGGDITATRNIVVDITGTTALGASPDAADEFMIWDSSASARKKVTYAEITAGFSSGSAGDIAETSFGIANNQASPANVTGFAFAAGVVRSFEALVSVEIDATLDLFEQFTLTGINKGGSFEMAQSAVGDESGVVFSITSGGQVQYTSANYSGFVSGDVKFRAITTSV